eukprot:TRINITY_DN27139_c0_g1_i1.p2 TRINITY_DN27139_c0_g1~~TRINITY_DN27139_c0_g1_i1.p2  ORF type:complete len:129 (+),score=20.09 TRINITY_DN27139_c0_g1_i1:38-424(+)
MTALVSHSNGGTSAPVTCASWLCRALGCAPVAAVEGPALGPSAARPMAAAPGAASGAAAVGSAGERLCLYCKKAPIEFKVDGCGHAGACKRCAMRTATGGKCKVCGELFPGWRRAYDDDSSSDGGKST